MAIAKWEFIRRTPEDAAILEARCVRVSKRVLARASKDPSAWNRLEKVQDRYWSDYNWYSPHA